MRVTVVVTVDGNDRPPLGSPLRVEVRDVAMADAAATVLCAAEARVGPGQLVALGPFVLAQVSCEFQEPPGMGIVWAHVDVDGDGRVSVGDYITKESYPLPAAADGTVTVQVLRV